MRLEVNRCALAGSLLERGALRYTPAGVPVIEFRLAHVSEQTEAGVLRRVTCELPCVAVGEITALLQTASLGENLAVVGFLAARSLRQPLPVLHATQVEFIEGI